MTETLTDFPTYFYKCNVCDSTDHGRAFYDYEIVECPGCGTRNMTRWEAKPNLSRDWSYCVAFGHDWHEPPGKQGTGYEVCQCCGSDRHLTKPAK